MSKGKSQKHIHIFWGLPGCGKTFYANSQKKGELYKVVHIDSFINKNLSKFELLERISYEVMKYYFKNENVILDGLFTTNAQIRDIIDYLKMKITNYDLVFHIVFWKEDRESCLFNDTYRRKLGSQASIMNMPLETPDLKLLPEVTQKRLTYMRVVRKSLETAWAQKVEFSESEIKDMEFRSSSWSLGGTWGDCWGNSGSCYPDEPKTEFIEFDRFIETNFPNMSFVQYNKLKGACVTTKFYDERDYYGGNVRRAYFSCDINKLYQELVDHDFIKTELNND